MRCTEGTSYPHHRILLIMKNIMKLKGFSVTKELHPISSTWSVGKDTLLKKTLGFPKLSSPQPRSSSKTTQTPSTKPAPSSQQQENMSSPIPHTVLPYIQYGTRIYTPNAAVDALLDTTLQDSCLASTLDHAINPQSPIGFIHEAYTHHMAMRNALISLIEYVPPNQEIHTLFTLLQCSDVCLH